MNKDYRGLTREDLLELLMQQLEENKRLKEYYQQLLQQEEKQQQIIQQAASQLDAIASICGLYDCLEKIVQVYRQK